MGTVRSVPPAWSEFRVKVRLARAGFVTSVVLTVGEITISKKSPAGPKALHPAPRQSVVLEQRWPTFSPLAQVPRFRVSTDDPAGSDGIRIAVSVMQEMSGSEVDSDIVSPVRLTLPRFWTTSRTRTVSP